MSPPARQGSYIPAVMLYISLKLDGSSLASTRFIQEQTLEQYSRLEKIEENRKKPSDCGIIGSDIACITLPRP